MKVEFFLDKTGAVKRELYFKLGEKGEWLIFDKLTEIEIESICDVLKKHTKAWEGLMHLSRHFSGKREILKQFVSCNWTSMDRHWDISDRKLRFEHVECPFKSSGKCPFSGKGIVCIKNKK